VHAYNKSRNNPINPITTE